MFYYTPPSQYTSYDQPPALIIEAPRKVNPWIAFAANPNFAFTPVSPMTTYSGTANGTAQATMQFYVMPNFDLVENVENLQAVIDISNPYKMEIHQPVQPRAQVEYTA